MKITKYNIEKEFKQFELTLKFDNQKEVAMFYSLFNYSPIADTIHENCSINCNKIREVIGISDDNFKAFNCLKDGLVRKI